MCLQFGYVLFWQNEIITKAGGKMLVNLTLDRKEKARKTAVDLFLEDAGPYSRKLYGPPPPSKETNGVKQKKLEKATTATTTKGQGRKKYFFQQR